MQNEIKTFEPHFLTQSELSLQKQAKRAFDYLFLPKVGLSLFTKGKTITLIFSKKN